MKSTIITLMAVASLVMSCSKIVPDTVELIQPVETKSMVSGNSDLNIYFTNKYSNDIDVTISEVNLCYIDSDVTTKESIYQGSMNISNEPMLLDRVNVDSGRTDNIYIEYTYSAILKINGCSLADNCINKSMFTKDANDILIDSWCDGEIYDYIFGPDFNQITFDTSVNNWNNKESIA